MSRSSAARATTARPASQPGHVPPSPHEPAAERPRQPATVRSSGHAWPIVTITAVLVAVSAFGMRYYSLPLGERVRSPLHPWLRPSGYVGQTAGILAFTIFIFLWLYPLRKRFRALAFTGSVGRWMDVHIVAALAMPLLVAIHGAWRFEGLIGLGYGAILVVCASGVVGRYFYTRIPRSRSGIELTKEEVMAQRRAILLRIAGTTGLDVTAVERTLNVAQAVPPNESPGRVLLRMFSNDLARWRMTRALRRRWRDLARGSRTIDRRAIDEAVKLASREMSLSQQARMLDATHRMLRYWHVAHRPVALTVLIAVIVHVAVVVALGATWFW